MVICIMKQNHEQVTKMEYQGTFFTKKCVPSNCEVCTIQWVDRYRLYLFCLVELLYWPTSLDNFGPLFCLFQVGNESCLGCACPWQYFKRPNLISLTYMFLLVRAYWA